MSVNLSCSPQGLGGVQVLEGWQIAASLLLSKANDTLQSDPQQQCSRWQCEELMIVSTSLQEVHPLLCFLQPLMLSLWLGSFWNSPSPLTFKCPSCSIHIRWSTTSSWHRFLSSPGAGGSGGPCVLYYLNLNVESFWVTCLKRMMLGWDLMTVKAIAYESYHFHTHQTIQCPH